MLNFLKSFVGKAQDAVTGSQVSRLKLHWQKIKDVYQELMDAQEGLDDPKTLSNSDMEHHLNEVVQAVVDEERDSTRYLDDTGPCFEFLLQENCVDTLCALGLPDRPPGMRVLITETLDLLFSRLRQPLLPNMNVHLAIRNFVNICVNKGDLQQPETRGKFLSFLRTMCLQLREDPSLAWVFFEDHHTQEHQFLIFSALMSLMNDGTEEANAAIEGILCCVQLPDQRICHWMTAETEFPYKLAKGAAELYERLPRTLATESAGEDIPDSPEFRYFWRRIKLIDVVAQSTFDEMSEAVAEQFVRIFLEPVITPLLMHVEENTARWATIYLRSMIERVESKHIQNAIFGYLLGHADAPETREEERKHPNRTTIIKRINSLSEDLSFATIGLFDAILATRNEFAFRNLLLRNLEAGSHIKPAAREQFVTAKLMLDVTVSQLSAPFSTLDRIMEEPSFEDYLVDAQEIEQQWLVTFSTWSSYHEVTEEDLEQALQAATSSLSIASLQETASARASVPASASASAPGAVANPEDDDENQVDDSVTPQGGAAGTQHEQDGDDYGAEVDGNEEEEEEIEDDDEPPFYEGLFLSSLFIKLETVFSNSFQTNLRLTNVLSKLAYCPHPVIHTYSMMPDLPLRKGARSPISELSKVWHQGRDRAEHMPDYDKRVIEAHKRLNDNDSTMIEMMDTERYFQGMIVLREFVKELLSIAQCKSALQRLGVQAKISHEDPPALLTD